MLNPCFHNMRAYYYLDYLHTSCVTVVYNSYLSLRNA